MRLLPRSVVLELRQAPILSDSVAMFEATHGTAPKYAGQNKVNPGSLILIGRNDVASYGLE